MLTTRNQDTRQNGMGRRTAAGAIAAIGFAGDDRWTQHALRQIVGGIQRIDIQEAQQVRTMFAQAFGKAGIVTIREAALGSDQDIQEKLQVLGALEEGEGIQAGFLGFQGQCCLQEHGHLAGKVQGSSTFALLHLFQVAQQVAHTFLLEPGFEFPIIAPTDTTTSRTNAANRRVSLP